MAERVELLQATFPAGTLVTSPVTFPLSFDPAIVRRMEIIVPPGPSGLMGFRIGHSRQVIIPFTGATWLITDDERIPWDLEGYPTGDAWFIEGYNEGLHDHTVYVRMLVDEIPSAVAAPITAVAIE